MMVPIKSEDFEFIFDPKSFMYVRDNVGMSKAKMAETLGVPLSTLSQWENGKTSPDAKVLAAICSIAHRGGINVDFFHRRVNKEEVIEEG